MGSLNQVPDQTPGTPYGVICRDHGKQGLTEVQYDKQMARPDSLWRCPICGDDANWDDERYETAMDKLYEAKKKIRDVVDP